MLKPVCMGLRDRRTDHIPRYLDGLTQYPSMLESDNLTVPMIWLLYPITLSRFVRSIETLIALQLHYLPTRIPEPEFLINRIDFCIILRRQRTLPRLKIILPMRLFPCLRMHNKPLLKFHANEICAVVRPFAFQISFSTGSSSSLPGAPARAARRR